MMRTTSVIGLRGIGLAALLLAVTGAEPARAQACIGYPRGYTGAVGGGFSFPEGATGYSLDGMVASEDGGMYFEGGFGILAPDDDDLENTKSLRGLAAYEVDALAPHMSLCPAVGATYAWVGDINSWTIPFGVAVGRTMRLDRRGAVGLTPFAIPQFLYVRTSLDDVEDSAESDVFVGLHAGLALNLRAIRVTGAVTKVFEEEMDAVFSVGLGAVWW